MPGPDTDRARSSAGEHTLHTGGVTGSIPVAPTMTSVHRTSPPGRMFRWEASVPEGLRIRERHEDAYAWALGQAARLRRGGAGLKGLDRAELSDFLEEWAEEMLSGARSQLVNLMAHAAKVARSPNPAVIGHCRSQCLELHDRLTQEYRASMRRRRRTARRRPPARRHVE